MRTALIFWGAASAYFIIRAIVPCGQIPLHIQASEVITIPAPTDYISDVALAHGIDPALVRAVIAAESAGNPLAVGKAGEAGLMQIGRWLQRGMADPFDPRLNVVVGTGYLAECLAQSRTAHEALRRYNAGPAGRGFRSWAYASRVLREKEGQ